MKLSAAHSSEGMHAQLEFFRRTFEESVGRLPHRRTFVRDAEHLDDGPSGWGLEAGSPPRSASLERQRQASLHRQLEELADELLQEQGPEPVPACPPQRNLVELLDAGWFFRSV